MRPLVKHCCSKAFSVVVYLDDGISGHQIFSMCEEQSSRVRSDLVSSGFVPNKDKCQWIPVQIICWLGICWDFKSNSLSTPPEKISGTFADVTGILSCRKTTDRNLLV